MATAISTKATAPLAGVLARTPAAPAEEIADALLEAEVRALAGSPLRRPGATYRLQLHRGFRLDDVVRIVDYLADLGITDCYFSPFLHARPGSTHGYDVFDHGRINPEIGDEAAHRRMVARLLERGMGRVLDVVPNHMGVGSTNQFWLDILELGPQAQSARFFDIDWNPVKDVLAGRLLLPILEDLYGKVLEAGLLKLEREGGSFWILYHQHRLPLSPRSYPRVLDRRAAEFRARFDPTDEDISEFLSIRDAIRNLPAPNSTDQEDLEHVRREKEIIKRRIGLLCAQSDRLRVFIDEDVASFRGTEGDARSFDAMHELLEDQIYRLAYWRVAAEEINYRRFFDVNELAGLRTEDPTIFDLTHELIFCWAREGGVTGLRIDHPDGLADPLGYFRRLQERLFLGACRERLDAEGRGDVWEQIVAPLRERYRATVTEDPSSPLFRRFPIVVEKILSRGESLPGNWPIDGTVGYEYLNVLNGIFIDTSVADEIDATYREFTGDQQPVAEVVHESKLLVADRLLASELTTLTRQLGRAAECDRKSRDFTLNDLRRVLREVIACFPVYRTYLQPGAPTLAQDREVIEQAVARARSRSPEVDATVFEFVRDVLLLQEPEILTEGCRARWDRFVIRFQQTTGPVQAKGLEDTTFYRQVRLASLNEVGGDPSRFGNSPSLFHALNVLRLKEWPGGLSATATHDTKRGEDARIRIDVLSELPGEWRTRLARWSRWNTRKRLALNQPPDAREEHLFYQTLIGAWPFGGPDDAPPEGFVARIQEYMVKAAREAKLNTSWIDPDPTYAEEFRQFVAETIGGPDIRPFLDDFLPFQRRVARVAVVHSLAQTLLKLVSPGIADIYQGCELWDFNLVDPDNRRPVDYEHRARLLDQIRGELSAGRPRVEVARRLFAQPEDGVIKLYLIWTVLNHRKADLPLYMQGTYRPLDVLGDLRGNVVPVLRRRDGRTTIAVAPRLVAGLMGDDASRPPLGRDAWGETQLVLPDLASAPRWRNLLTDQA
ncbi:MAG: malto-oligosyltrehalose synthase, partial [Singulisphaera sp.]|nr:malto-oligosyltrehalose synthase [Singulisphaera sp.]